MTPPQALGQAVPSRRALLAWSWAGSSEGGAAGAPGGTSCLGAESSQGPCAVVNQGHSPGVVLGPCNSS